MKLAPNKLYHISKQEITDPKDLRIVTKGQFTTQNKPSGMWYSPGTHWVDSCVNNKYRLGEYHIYELDTSQTKILKINGIDQLKTLPTKPNILFSSKVPDWEKIQDHYQGIEISGISKLDYGNNLFHWHRNWHVDSGCLWDLNNLAITDWGKIVLGDKKVTLNPKAIKQTHKIYDIDRKVEQPEFKRTNSSIPSIVQNTEFRIPKMRKRATPHTPQLATMAIDLE